MNYYTVMKNKPHTAGWMTHRKQEKMQECVLTVPPAQVGQCADLVYDARSRVVLTWRGRGPGRRGEAAGAGHAYFLTWVLAAQRLATPT